MNVSRRLVANLQTYHRHRARRDPWGRAVTALAKLCHKLWVWLAACDISREARIAPTVQLPHPNGVVIHQEAVVEDEVMIMQQVTLGQVAGPGAPVVCRGAYIGAGAKVLGAVRIGRNARVGANAVVLEDVPDNATAVGIPARIVRRRD